MHTCSANDFFIFSSVDDFMYPSPVLHQQITKIHLQHMPPCFLANAVCRKTLSNHRSYTESAYIIFIHTFFFLLFFITIFLNGPCDTRPSTILPNRQRSWSAYERGPIRKNSPHSPVSKPLLASASTCVWARCFDQSSPALTARVRETVVPLPRRLREQHNSTMATSGTPRKQLRGATVSFGGS